jgi:hypothetical protein
VSGEGPQGEGDELLPARLVAPASWSGPVSNAAVAITFKQLVKDTDALRTGTYSRTLTLTLSTTGP